MGPTVITLGALDGAVTGARPGATAVLPTCPGQSAARLSRNRRTGGFGPVARGRHDALSAQRSTSDACSTLQAVRPWRTILVMTEEEPDKLSRIPVVGWSSGRHDEKRLSHLPFFLLPGRQANMVLAHAARMRRLHSELPAEKQLSVRTPPIPRFMKSTWNRRLIKLLSDGLKSRGFEVTRAWMEHNSEVFVRYAAPSQH